MKRPITSYPLGYTEDEARRLAAQAAYLEDLAGDVLRRAGLGAGMQVLDLGCGVGDLSFLAARMVGAAGTVLGIDRNASSIETARHRAVGLGVSNVQFEVSEVDGGRCPYRAFGVAVSAGPHGNAAAISKLSKTWRSDGISRDRYGSGFAVSFH
jgi:cyclopropane fatty-acyl-phospholipid synthase-like methyltransferase